MWAKCEKQGIHKIMDTQKKARIFISYKRVDKDRVFELKKEIENETGEKCWIDLDGIESDAQFVEVIMNAIDNCDVFIFMRSKEHDKINNLSTDWTIREVNYALGEKKNIVILNLDDTPMPRWFRFMFPQKQEIDALDIDKLEHLYADLRGWLQTSIQTGDVPDKLYSDDESDEKFSAWWTILGFVLIFAVLIPLCWSPFALYGRFVSNRFAEKGHTYFYGTNEIPQDYKQAVVYYKRGTRGSKYTNPNFGLASYNLAICYEEGLGTAINHEEALSWYKKSAKHNNVVAMYKLADSYENGKLGLDRDSAKAQKWLKKVASKEGYKTTNTNAVDVEEF